MMKKCGKVVMIVTMHASWPCALDKLSTVYSVLMCLLLSCVFTPLANGHLTFSPSGLKTFQDAQTTRYFRQLVTDPSNGALYVGAMEYLYRLDQANISDKTSSLFMRSVNISANNPAYVFNYEQCVTMQYMSPLSDYYCRNHIRAIALYKTQVYVCLTGGITQQDVFFDRSTLRQVTYGQSSSGIFKCSVNPDDNTTLILVDSGGPAPNITTAISGGYSDLDPTDVAIFRPSIDTGGLSPLGNIRTYRGNLVKAQFVKSFQSDAAVYFLFRETASEMKCPYPYCQLVTFSRVGRMCKADKGGSSTSGYQNNIVTFLKTRLTCSIPGTANFYFDQIYDAADLDYGNGSRRFYGVFSSSTNGNIYGSAICSYAISSIDSVFDTSDFLVQDNANPNSYWQTMSPPFSRRPGKCGYDTSQSSYDEVAKFISTRSLMRNPVDADGGRPIFYQRDVVFQRIAVDSSENSVLIYLATNDGRVFKVSSWFTAGNSIDSRLLAILFPLSSPASRLPIWSLIISGMNVYASTDDRVVQFNKYQCDKYSSCVDCVVDPHCGYDRLTGKCDLYKVGLLQNISTASPLLTCNGLSEAAVYCQGPPRPSVSIALQGLPVLLSCSSSCVSPSTSVSWAKDYEPIVFSSSKYVLTAGGELVIFNVSQSDEGMYRCLSQAAPSVVLAEQYVNVTECVSAECTWKQAFLKWCSDYKQYKTNFNQWVCYKDTFVEKVQHNQTCLPSDSLSKCQAIQVSTPIATLNP